MIITTQKPFPEILELLSRHKNIFIVGCAACATKCRTGGEEALAVMAAALENEGKTISGRKILDTPCDIRVARKDLKEIAACADDAVLVLACGAGVQAVEKAVSLVVYPALNPVFTGTTERIGLYHEYCSLCGDCILGKTGGICPVTRCAKGLVNGPCGGAVSGKCEVDRDNDCAWILIAEKIKNNPSDKNILKIFVPARTVVKPGRITPPVKK